MKKLLILLVLLSAAVRAAGAPKRVYVFPLRESIMPSTWRLASKCLAEAVDGDYDLVVIDMNTYGGLMDVADSIRTAVLGCPLPVYVLVNNQAVSAGALISIAADSIFMRPGAAMGAATVVGGNGEAMPDKYQSFMRSMMRSTAEFHGKVPEKTTGGDTTWRWMRDPRIAEAMVDPAIEVPGLVDGTGVLTFTTEEAIAWHYCEGRAESVEQVLSLAGVTDYRIDRYRPDRMDGLMGFLTNPAFQGILIMLIVGGIYFELQTPGVGFPLAVSILSAALYFSPLYAEGLVSNWEIVLFAAGIILILLEIFVIPGFGIAGIAGILAVVAGLSLAAVDSGILKYIPTGEVSAGYLLVPVSTVMISVTLALVLCIWLGRRFLAGGSALRGKVVLTVDMTAREGYISNPDVSGMVGREGIASTALRPAGHVRIDGRLYEAAGDNGMFVDRGVRVVVVRDQTGVLYCRSAEEKAF